ncbi:MAG: molybdopterin molybdotransferase MoeA [Chloroflexota bacterium]|nr:molybdopterin molybdotransferase MoeA [Chloroflexota bacterium]MDE2961275.1 molybdopterin molybdotransferase MoeA [Chloroflexota bacterium]
MTTHQHPRHLHAHDAHGDGDHESIHDHGHVDRDHREHGHHGHGGQHRGHSDGPGHDGHGHEDMLEVEQAFERIIAHFSPLDAVELPVLECLGLALAEDVTSPLNLPPLANSAMDGYAVLHDDIATADDAAPKLAVISAVAAGQVSDQTVTKGTAIRIMTGAPVPDGADTVVPFEETDELDRRRAGTPLDEIVIHKALPLGSNVRPAGEDVRAGELVLPAGTVVRPAEAGVLASLGLATARVIRRPVVAVLSTGDELTKVGQELAPGHIYDSNSSSVAAAVRAAGGEAKLIGIARDNLDDLHRCIDAASDADLLVTSAGVSKGDYDMVKDVLEQRGDMNFWSVRMRPAKPLAFGLIQREGREPLPLLGLPGNPVSALLAFEMFGRAAVRRMLGRDLLTRPAVEGVLMGPIFNSDGRRVYARVEVERRDGAWYATPTGPQGSNILTSLSKANGLAICPADLPRKNAGQAVKIIMLDWNEEVSA